MKNEIVLVLYAVYDTTKIKNNVSMYCQNKFNHISMTQSVREPHNHLEFYTQLEKLVFMTRASFIYLRRFFNLTQGRWPTHFNTLN